MRRSTLWFTSAILALLLLVCGTANTHAQGRYTASYQDFYDGLSPYGQWIQDPQYGYVWLPDVDADFRPYYTNGYWANTEYGNTWVSDYDWGWAPFHYGRWTYDSYYGWLWIPDTEWAPAWVSWRSSNDYYGWAPMGPGINVNLNLGLIPVDWWVFITPGYFYNPSFYRYCNNDYRFRRGIYGRTNIINYTYVDNRTTYYTGPRSDDYYRQTGRRPSMFNIDNNNRRGATRVSGNRINMYRPGIRKTANAVPAHVVQTDRAVTRKPQVFNGTAEKAQGRTIILKQNNLSNGQQTPGKINTGTRMNDVPSRPANQGAVPQQQEIQVQQRNVRLQQTQQNPIPVQQQRDAQLQQQAQQRQIQVQQQRDAQLQQQQTQQRQLQVQQQRDAQLQQQQTQQRQLQVQQQRDAQLQQQQAQQRQIQVQQQRDAQLQQQQAQQRQLQVQQQRDAQLQQQAQQRQIQQQDVQNKQQRMQAPANNSQPAQMQQRSAPMRMGGR